MVTVEAGVGCGVVGVGVVDVKGTWQIDGIVDRKLYSSTCQEPSWFRARNPVVVGLKPVGTKSIAVSSSQPNKTSPEGYTTQYPPTAAAVTPCVTNSCRSSAFRELE